MGWLAQVQQGANTLASYFYNAQGQRTRKVTPSGTVVYHYDLAGNLIGESDSGGTPIRDYLWHDATPIAQIDSGPTETLVFLHTDHLQTPRLATNTAGIAIWRWEGAAFGGSPPNEDVDGNGQSTTVNLRFPGQYFDGETGRYYNWNRYYDSTVGRYITSDPIGLAGGLSTYLYAQANPTALTDFMGLQSLPLPRPVPRPPFVVPNPTSGDVIDFPQDRTDGRSRDRLRDRSRDRAEDRPRQCPPNRDCTWTGRATIDRVSVYQWKVTCWYRCPNTSRLKRLEVVTSQRIDDPNHVFGNLLSLFCPAQVAESLLR